MILHSRSPAADEMNDLDLVVVHDFRCFPILSADDSSVYFNGDALGGHVEAGEEIVQLETLGNLHRLSIDKNSHIEMIQEFLRKQTAGLKQKLLSVTHSLANFDFLALTDRPGNDSRAARLEWRYL